MIEEPVEILRPGARLLGVLHHAAPSAEPRGVLLVSGGLANRAGPHRMYAKASRRLAAAGVASLRFDFPGIGESPGTLREIGFDLFEPEDVLAAAEALVARARLERLTLFGLCTGARAVVRAGRVLLDRRLPARLDGLLLFSLPVMEESDFPFTAEYGFFMTKGAAVHMTRTNARKLLSARSWRRLLTGKSDYGFLARLFASRARHATSGSPANAASESLARDAGALFDRGIPMALVFGEEDLLKRRCEEHFLPRFEAARAAGLLTVETVHGGHHSFDEPVSEAAALDLLERRFAAPARPASSVRVPAS